MRIDAKLFSAASIPKWRRKTRTRKALEWWIKNKLGGGKRGKSDSHKNATPWVSDIITVLAGKEKFCAKFPSFSFNFSSGVTNLGNIQYLISAVCNRINQPIPTRGNSLFTLSPWLIGPFPKKGVADDATAYRPETPQNRQLLQFTAATLSKIRSPSVVGSRWSIRRKRVIIDILSCCRRKPRKERASEQPLPLRFESCSKGEIFSVFMEKSSSSGFVSECGVPGYRILGAICCFLHYSYTKYSRRLSRKWFLIIWWRYLGVVGQTLFCPRKTITILGIVHVVGGIYFAAGWSQRVNRNKGFLV